MTIWHIAATDPPQMFCSEYFWPASRPVLVYLAGTEKMIVATYEEVDSDFPCCWYTADSERWDITTRVTHWADLPSPPKE